MNVGMVCWALIGGQGRYRLATMIFSACTLLITLPIALYLTLAMRYNLKGLTFAVVVGYSTTAMCLTYVLLMSNWEKIALKVQSKSKVDDDEYSDSMSTEGSSESESESTSRETYTAYEMSLTQTNESSRFAADDDEGSATFYINAQPLDSSTNQERPREIDHIQGAQYGIQYDQQYPQQQQPFQQHDQRALDDQSEDEGKAHQAYEMSLSGSEVAADEGSSTFYINAQPLASPTNQERPREQPGIMKKVFGHLNSRVAKLEDKESQYAQTPQSGVRSIIRTEPLSLNFAKPSKGKKRGGYRAQLILDKSPKKASELYEL